jgi:hypothetical protein
LRSNHSSGLPQASRFTWVGLILASIGPTISVRLRGRARGVAGATGGVRARTRSRQARRRTRTGNLFITPARPGGACAVPRSSATTAAPAWGFGGVGPERAPPRVGGCGLPWTPRFWTCQPRAQGPAYRLAGNTPASDPNRRDRASPISAWLLLGDPPAMLFRNHIEGLNKTAAELRRQPLKPQAKCALAGLIPGSPTRVRSIV